MKENMKRKIAMLLTLLGVTSIVIGTTFAIYENTINTNKNHIIKTGVVNFTLTESTNGIVLNNLQELTDYEGMAQEEYYEFTIKNTGDTKTDYEISLVDKPNSSYTGTILNEKYIKVGLLKNNSEEIIVNLKEVNRLIDKVTLDIDKSANYKLRLWLDLKDITDEGKEALVGQKIFLALKINGIQNMENITIAADKLIALTNNKDNSGLYTITHEADNTLQIGTNEDITEYRYRGASPKNYVIFNNEVWRILGVFPTDDGTGKIENRIKLIRNESIGSYAWNSNDEKPSNAWVRRYNTGNDATLNVYLNNTYINTLTNNSKNMISDVKYYLGGHGGGNYKNAQEMYSYERKISGDNFYTNGFKTNWLGKIALMYASDYGYASSNCETNIFVETASDGFPPATSTKDIRVCNDTNWLYNIKVNEWLLDHSPRSDDSTYSIYLFYIAGQGYIDCRYSTYAWSKLNVRPTLYLKSDVKITGGDGTSTNPYTLGL